MTGPIVIINGTLQLQLSKSFATILGTGLSYKIYVVTEQFNKNLLFVNVDIAKS